MDNFFPGPIRELRLQKRLKRQLFQRLPPENFLPGRNRVRAIVTTTTTTGNVNELHKSEKATPKLYFQKPHQVLTLKILENSPDLDEGGERMSNPCEICPEISSQQANMLQGKILCLSLIPGWGKGIPPIPAPIWLSNFT